jgi:hypothetical protein
MLIRRLSLAAAGAAASVVALVATVAHGSSVEEPAYTLESAHDGWEIRRYAPTLEARVTTRGSFDTAVSDGFRLLAAYIFGKNAPNVSIAMTAPVSAEPAPGTAIAMTAPVSAQSAGDQAWTIAFTMPASWTLQTLPTPLDPRVTLVSVPGARVAARPFPGWATSERIAAEQARLLADLARAGQTPGTPRIAQYDPPWTPPALRRNEILVPLPPAAP